MTLKMTICDLSKNMVTLPTLAISDVVTTMTLMTLLSFYSYKGG